MTKRADRIMDERCKRTGSNWRCPEKTLPGKIYCEKHYKYSVSRNNCRKVKKTSAVKCDSSLVVSASASASAAVVEPYRPVIDFDAGDGGGSGGGENVGGLVNDGELMGWLLGDNGWNDQFANRDSGGGGRGGGNDDFTLGRESGDGS